MIRYTKKLMAASQGSESLSRSNLAWIHKTQPYQCNVNKANHTLQWKQTVASTVNDYYTYVNSKVREKIDNRLSVIIAF